MFILAITISINGNNKVSTTSNSSNNDNVYDRVQDRGHKIVSFEDKIHGAFNMKVIQFLQSLYCG